MRMNGSHSSRRELHLRWGLVVCLLLGTAGCGSKGTIAGKVLYQGKPLPGGTVTFHHASKGAFSALIQKDGSYSLSQVPSGEVKITVETESLSPSYMKGVQEKLGRYKMKMMKTLREKEMIPEGEDKESLSSKNAKYVRIPAQYMDPGGSGLTYTVTGGEQTHDIELK